eukprot:SAG31_NODE_5682_length_2383_cov_1.567426_3_plen_73_part_00
MMKDSFTQQSKPNGAYTAVHKVCDFALLDWLHAFTPASFRWIFMNWIKSGVYGDPINYAAGSSWSIYWDFAI